eukprot:g79016.t1
MESWLSRESAQIRNLVDPATTFDPEDPLIKREMVALILDYLSSEGYTSASLVLRDEANINFEDQSRHTVRIQSICRAVAEGDWSGAEKQCSKTTLKGNYKHVLYALYKQQYLEMIDKQEYQKAFTFLNKRLKPFENLHKQGSEFNELCYLLTCKSVQEAHSFRDWQGVLSSREKLVQYLEALLGVSSTSNQITNMYAQDPEGDGSETKLEDVGVAASSDPSAPLQVRSGRLTELIQRAVAYNLQFSPYQSMLASSSSPSLLHDFRSMLASSSSPSLLHDFRSMLASSSSPSLLHDFRVLAIPNRLVCSLPMTRSVRREGGVSRLSLQSPRDHPSYPKPQHVKCVSFLGAMGCRKVAAGGGDNLVRVWHLNEQALSGPCVELAGHTSRIWDLAPHPNGNLLASASGDSTVKLWDLSYLDHHLQGRDNFDSPAPPDPILLQSKLGDVYTVSIHPRTGAHLVTGGYARALHLYDVNTTQLVRAYYGHSSSISSSCFSQFGNLVVTGSKDFSIRFWDTVSGACIQTLRYPLGEVSSVAINEAGTQLLSAHRDASNRLWDLRTSKPLMRLKGHQNTSKNFIRAAFGSNQQVVLGGSEDGRVYVWDVQSGQIVQRLSHHRGVAYQAAWQEEAGYLASCGSDGQVCLWVFDPQLGQQAKRGRDRDNSRDSDKDKDKDRDRDRDDGAPILSSSSYSSSSSSFSSASTPASSSTSSASTPAVSACSTPSTAMSNLWDGPSNASSNWPPFPSPKSHNQLTQAPTSQVGSSKHHQLPTLARPHPHAHSHSHSRTAAGHRRHGSSHHANFHLFLGPITAKISSKNTLLRGDSPKSLPPSLSSASFSSSALPSSTTTSSTTTTSSSSSSSSQPGNSFPLDPLTVTPPTRKLGTVSPPPPQPQTLGAGGTNANAGTRKMDR